MLEHDIIAEFFTPKIIKDNQHVLCGVSDDAAIIRIPENQVLATSVDTMVAGVHFFHHTKAEDIGYKSLAVSLSDMAAMGAQPKTALLALTIPEATVEWLTDFNHGFCELIEKYQIDLIGGDMTQGPLTVTTIVNGWVPEKKFITRNRAKADDLIFVSGTLGDAGFVIDQIKKSQRFSASLAQRLHRPIAQIELGIILREFATSAIDISDGLLTDLTKIIQNSSVGATVYLENIPLSSELLAQCDYSRALQFALTAGDDYELCFTVPKNIAPQLKAICEKQNITITQIGIITSDNELIVLDESGHTQVYNNTGYEHFST